MNAKILGKRLLSQHSNISLTKIRKQNEIDVFEFGQLEKSMNQLKSMDKNLFISNGENKRGDTVEDLIMWIKRMYEYEGIKSVYLDYLQRIRATYPRSKRDEQVRHIAYELKQTAEELGIHICALAQLNRSAADVQPLISHLGESSFIEQEASIVLLLDRLDYGTNASKKHYTARVEGSDNTSKQVLTGEQLQDKMIITMGKNRNGKKERIYLDINMNTLKLGEISKFNNGTYTTKEASII